MFCSNCGAPVGDQEKFCSVCGTPVSVQAAPAAQSPVPQQAPVVQQPAAYQPAPAPQPVPYQPAAYQPAPATQPAAYQAVPPVYQQPVQAAPRLVTQPVAPAPANVKAGPRRACFVTGLISCILLMIANGPALVMGGLMLVVGPLAMMFNANNSEDIIIIGLLACCGAFLLIDVAVVSIVFNAISTKITAKRPASKCRSFRTAASIMVLIDALITVLPIIGINSLYQDDNVMLLYAFYAVALIMAIVYLVLAIITNKKEKDVASSQS